MSSESVSAFGQPSETKPTVGAVSGIARFSQSGPYRLGGKPGKTAPACTICSCIFSNIVRDCSR
jgi:hypothetical protein